MRRFTILLILALLPLTLAPRLARRPAPVVGGPLTHAVTVRDSGDVGGTVPVQVRVTNGSTTDLPTAKVRITVPGTGVSLLGSSHGCTPASATVLSPLTCTVNVPAGMSRVVNAVLRAPSTGAGNVTATFTQS